MMNDETDKQQLRAPTALTRGRLNHSKTRHFWSLREKVKRRVFIYLFSGDICAVVFGSLELFVEIETLILIRDVVLLLEKYWSVRINNLAPLP
jgi:hypothetical protein